MLSRLAGLATVSLLVLSGCASPAPTGASTHPIIGAWTLDSSMNAPAGVLIELDFRADGTLVQRHRFPPETEIDVTTTRFRFEGDRVFTDPEKGGGELLYELHDGKLVLHDKSEPGVLVFRRAAP